MKRTKFTLVAAVLSLGLSTPVQAMSDEAANCPAARMNEESKALLAEFLASQADIMPDAISIDLASAVTICAGKYDLNDTESEAIMYFTLSSLIADAAGKALESAGIPTAIVEETADVGPGRTNTQPLKFTITEAEKLVAALTAAGIDANGISEDLWSQVGIYLASVLERQTLLIPFRD